MPKVLMQTQDSVACITLNEPGSYNALTPQLVAELGKAITSANAEPTVHAVLITGAGKGFCAGANLAPEILARGDAVAPFICEGLNPLLESIRTSPKPFVVAVNGPAAGAGVGLALSGDIVLAAQGARFVLSFSRIGAALDAGTSWYLTKTIGSARTRALALLGEAVDAETAERWGLIWRAVVPDQLLEQARDIATRLATGPRVSLGLIKDELNRAETGTFRAALASEAEAQIAAFQTEDLREGAAAFMEKRAARFSGK